MSPASAAAGLRTARQLPSPAAVTERGAVSISTMVCRTLPPPKCRPAPRARLWKPAATADRCSASSRVSPCEAPMARPSREWAVGMKMVVDLPSDSPLEPGTVFHTFGYPEPEIFGFFYVHPDRVATVGIFVPSWFRSPARTSYRYLQHFMLHPRSEERRV